MSHERGAQSRRLRIIAGRWRGRRWRFAAGGIRPTSERVRETLFNWLQGRLEGRRCLDLYAGSGALGLEALSRGAAHCVFVDQQQEAVARLGDVLREWQAGSAEVELECSSAAQFLARPARAFDLVFLDPPFAGGELARGVAQLESRGWLASGALIYLEHPRSAPPAAVPANWQPLRAGTAGAVGYDLYQRGQSGRAT
ncbi:MAG: 16S rRNA (guanine(966)-N(2))-methyltransferase RsmD [Gammaproteobacteria bacterium]|nr:16S rRNA (guanine(966)-N(2))-methyltransferase RsmD [Gammaproteobacteria bacterium]MDE2250960.1 16S rRNA (guanine(966)-N(2))-methyltransferase RsmD [Gammaproteobacteria bacterium]